MPDRAGLLKNRGEGVGRLGGGASGESGRLLRGRGWVRVGDEGHGITVYSVMVFIENRLSALSRPRLELVLTGSGRANGTRGHRWMWARY